MTDSRQPRETSADGAQEPMAEQRVAGAAIRTRSLDTRIGGLQIVIITLTLLTAVLHLVATFAAETTSDAAAAGIGGEPWFAVLWILDAAAYVGLVIVRYAPIRALRVWRPVARLLLLVLVFANLVAWGVIEGKDRDLLGYSTKVVELVLFGALVAELGQEKGPPRREVVDREASIDPAHRPR